MLSVKRLRAATGAVALASLVAASDATACPGPYVVCPTVAPPAQKVLVNPRVHVIFWKWNASPSISDPNNLRPTILDAVASIGGSMNANVVTQYYSGYPGAPAYAGNPNGMYVDYLDDTAANDPGNPLPQVTDPNLSVKQGNLINFWKAQRNWSFGDIIVVAYPSDAGAYGYYCAFNGFNPNSGVDEVSLIYGGGYPADGCYPGGTTPDKTYRVLTHEIAELIPDPDGTGWSNGGADIADGLAAPNDCQNMARWNMPFPIPSKLGGTYRRPAMISNSANNGNGGCVYARGNHAAIFGIGATGGHLWAMQGNGNDQSFPGPHWGGWQDFGAPAGVTLSSGKVAAVGLGYGIVDTYARSGNTLYWGRHDMNLGTHTWHNIGMPSACSASQPMSDPDALAVDPAHSEVWVGCGTGGTSLYRLATNQLFQSWTPLYLGGFIAKTGPGVVSWDGQRRDLFFGGTDPALQHPGDLIHAWTLDNQHWYVQPIGTPASGAYVASSPDAASFQQNRLDVVWRDSAGQVQRWLWDNIVPPGSSGFYAWPGGGTFPVSSLYPPAIAGLGDNRQNIIATDTSGKIWLSSYLDGVLTPWSLGPNNGGVTTGSDIATW